MDNTKTIHNIGYNARIQIEDGIVTIDIVEYVPTKYGKQPEWREITFKKKKNIKKFRFLLNEHNA